MKRFLNNPATNCSIPVDKPSIQHLQIHDSHFLLDVNSLRIMEVSESMVKPILDNMDDYPILFSSYKPSYPLSVRTRGIKKLVLNLTLACNLRCSYCFVQDYDLPVMPIEYATKAINMFDTNRVDVSFFGGEPLLCWELLKAVVSYGQHKDPKAKFHLTTNGVLLDEEKAKFIKDNHISILLSLDGPKIYHDAVRKDANEEGTFDRIIDNLKMLKSLNVKPPFVRGTFSETPSHLVDRVRFLSDLKTQGLISGCSVEPAIFSESCQKRQGKYDMKIFAEELHNLAEWYLHRIEERNPFYYMYFDKFLDKIKNSKPRCSECGGGNYYLTVGPKGGIYACHRQEGTQIGHMTYGLDTELTQPWQDNRYYLNSNCNQCWAKNLCGGGCRQTAIATTGNIHERSGIMCSFRRLYIKEAIWLMSKIKSMENILV